MALLTPAQKPRGLRRKTCILSKYNCNNFMFCKIFFVNLVFSILLYYSNCAFADKIIATIGNKSIITENELNENIKLDAKIRKISIGAGGAIDFLRQIVLKEMINRKIFYLHGLNSGINIEKINIENDIINFSNKNLGCIKNIESCIKDRGFHYYYIKQRLLEEVVMTIIVSSGIDRNISDAEIEYEINAAGLPSNQSNKKDIASKIINQRFNSALSRNSAMLSKFYYVEIVE